MDTPVFSDQQKPTLIIFVQTKKVVYRAYKEGWSIVMRGRSRREFSVRIDDDDDDEG